MAKVRKAGTQKKVENRTSDTKEKASSMDVRRLILQPSWDECTVILRLLYELTGPREVTQPVAQIPGEHHTCDPTTDLMGIHPVILTGPEPVRHSQPRLTQQQSNVNNRTKGPSKVQDALPAVAIRSFDKQ